MFRERPSVSENLKTDRPLTTEEVLAGEREEAGLEEEFKKRLEQGELVKDEKLDEKTGKRLGVMLRKKSGGAGENKKGEIVYWQDERMKEIQERERKFESAWEEALFGDALDNMLENYKGPEQ